MVTLAAVGAETSLGRSAFDAPLPTPANLSDTAVLADGTIVAVTLRQIPDEGWTLYQQRFAADGRALDPAPVAVDAAQKGGAFGSPEVIALDGGGFVVAWTETAPGAGPNKNTAAYSVYGADGGLLRTEVLGVFDHGASVTGAAAPGGGFTLGWAGAEGQSAPHFFTNAFNASGAPTGARTLVSAQAASADPILAPTGDGGYLAMWGDHGRYFDGDGFGAELALERVDDGVFGGMDAVRLASGDIAVVWSEVKVSGYLPDPRAQAFLQVFHPDTGAFGPRTLLSGASGFQLLPQAVALDDGGLAVTWRGQGTEGHTEVGFYGPDGALRGVQDAHGDFVGVDHGQILSTRLDSDGGFWLQRYAVDGHAEPSPPPAPVVQPPPEPVDEAQAPPAPLEPAPQPEPPQPEQPQPEPEQPPAVEQPQAPAGPAFQYRGDADARFDRADADTTVSLLGSGQGDVIRAGAGADVVDGAAGDDDLQGGAGADRMRGGAGDDVFVFRAGDLVGAGGAVDHVVDFHGGAGPTGERDALAFVGFGPDAEFVFDHYGQRGGVADQNLQYFRLTDGAETFLILVQVADAAGPGAEDYAFYAG